MNEALRTFLARLDPATLRVCLILAAIAYFVMPFDFIPDFMGLPARADDAAVMAWLVWLYRDVRRRAADPAGPDASGQASGGGTEGDASGRSTDAGAFDPYAVLGISPGASPDAIRAAYRERMQEYHPDKVAHLGEDLQALAHARSQEIQRAYRALAD